MEQQEFYVSGVREYEHDGQTHCEAVPDDKDAQYWSVYRVNHMGHSDALCDCPTRANAEFVVGRLNFVNQVRDELNTMLAK